MHQSTSGVGVLQRETAHLSAFSSTVSELGELGLTDAEESAIVKFMQTLSDGFEPAAGTKRLTPGLR